MKLVAAASWGWGWCRSCIAAASCWSSGTAAGLLACMQTGQKAFSLRSWCTGWSSIASWSCIAAASCRCCTRCWSWSCTRCRSCIAAAFYWSGCTAASLLASVQAGQEAFSLRSWCTSWSCIASRCWCWFACCYCSAAASCLACVQTSQQSFSLRGWCTGRSCIANRCWCWCWCTASSRSTAAILLAAENTSRSTRRGRDRTSNNRQSNNQSTHSKFSNNKKGYTAARVVHSMAAYSLLRVGRSNAARPSMSTRVSSIQVSPQNRFGEPRP